MLKERDRVVRNAMALFDAFVVAISFLAAFFLRKHFHSFYSFNLIPQAQLVADASSLSLREYGIVLILVMPIWLVMLHASGMYRSLRTKTVPDVVVIVIKAVLLTALIFGAAVFLFKLKFVSRAFFVIFILISSTLIIAEKTAIFFVMRYIRKKGYNYRMLLVVGTGRRSGQFIRRVKEHPEWGLRIIGVLDYEEPPAQNVEVEGIKIIGSLDKLESFLHRNTVDQVVFIVPRSKLDLIEKSLYRCETEGVNVAIAADLFELKIAKARVTELEGMPLVTFETARAKEWQLFIKRALDIVVAGLALVISSPLFVAAAILIKLTSRGGVFYLQKRIGLSGRKFVLYKFRSMYKGSHAKISELTGRNEMTGPVFKMKRDPRVTPVGKFLRKSSIDELPQLLNVLFGDMSLVGPRPAIPQEVARYEPWQRRRLSMRPGITCIWQISGRSNIDFEEWMKLDLRYIDNWSLALDFKILCKTAPVVLFGSGAY